MTTPTRAEVIEQAYADSFGVGPMPTNSKEWFALGFRAALTRPAAATPVPSTEAAWLLETSDQSHRYFVEGRPGHPAHMTSNPWDATRFKTRSDAALKFAHMGTGTLAALGIPSDLRPIEHEFISPSPVEEARQPIVAWGVERGSDRAIVAAFVAPANAAQAAREIGAVDTDDTYCAVPLARANTGERAAKGGDRG